MSKVEGNRDLREEALNILKDAFREVLDDESNTISNTEIDERLIEEVFFQAWENQFSDDSSKFKKSVRKIIRDMTKSTDENQ